MPPEVLTDAATAATAKAAQPVPDVANPEPGLQDEFSDWAVKKGLYATGPVSSAPCTPMPAAPPVTRAASSLKISPPAPRGVAPKPLAPKPLEMVSPSPASAPPSTKGHLGPSGSNPMGTILRGPPANRLKMPAISADSVKIKKPRAPPVHRPKHAGMSSSNNSPAEPAGQARREQ